MAIKWLELNSYNEYEKEHYGSKNRFIDETLSFSLSDDYFEKIIDAAPYLTNDEEYGLTKTWFGKIGDDIFVLMVHPEAEKPFGILGAENYRILSKLDGLGYEFYTSIKWMRGNLFDATYSVFTKDNLGVELEIFRAKTNKDADSMAAFLNLRGKTVEFYAKESDDLNLHWGIFEKFSEKLVGKSHDRVSAEYFGIEYTKKNNVPTFITTIEKDK